MTLLTGTNARRRGAPSTVGHWRRGWRLPLFIAAIASFCAFLPQFALAQWPPAHVFFGTVTINRLPPKDGTVLTAFVDGRKAASTTVIDGVFEFPVNRPADRPLAGKVVRFKVGGLETSARAIWEAGQETELNIRVIQVFQTPVPIPRRQAATLPAGNQDTREVEDIQKKIQVLTQDRANVETSLKEQINSKLAALDGAIDRRKEDLRAAAGEELDAVARKVENAVNRPRLNPLNPQQIRRLKSEVESTETDLREDFDQKMRLLDQERADRESELVRLANAELDDLDRRIKEMEQELARRIFEQNAPRILREEDRPVGSVRSEEAVAASKTAEPEPDGTAGVRKKNSPSRGFFVNSVSGNVSGIDGSLDPTTIAVLGILITLVATTIQLVKGN